MESLLNQFYNKYSQDILICMKSLFYFFLLNPLETVEEMAQESGLYMPLVTHCLFFSLLNDSVM
jgi:hypothetical protein